MMHAGLTTSVHFPPAPARQPEAAHSVPHLQTYASALADVELVRDQLRRLLTSENRHGDLQVALSALKRLQPAIQILIDAEEAS